MDNRLEQEANAPKERRVGPTKRLSTDAVQSGGDNGELHSALFLFLPAM